MWGVACSTMPVNRIGAINQDGCVPFTAFSSLLSQYRCCFRIRRFTMHSLAQVPGIGAVANPLPFSHDRAIRSRPVTTRENPIVATGLTSQSYSVANPNGSETRRHSTEPVPSDDYR